ncbi:MAG: AAA family ATPase [Desulfococcaceae bacterium]
MGEMMPPKCYIIAGPNGAGKTTFAYDFLPIEAECLTFINADLIARGLSPFQPEKVAIRAGRMMLRQIDDCVRRKESFAFETTFSGQGYVAKITKWREMGYQIMMFYLKLPTAEFAVNRVRHRVSMGGHDVPEAVIRRRFQKSWDNFQNIYKNLADSWIVFDTSGELSKIIEQSGGKDGKQ